MKNAIQKYFSLQLLDNNGSTLVELLVAMGLLLAVILPAGAFLGYMANFPENKEKIIALGEAQTTLEQMISRNKYVKGKEIIPIKPGWKLKEEILIHGKKAMLQVTVFRRDKITVELSTVRLLKGGGKND